MFHYNEKMRFTIVFLALLWALPTWARVFNLATETKAVYLKGNVGLSNLGEDAYINSSGSSTVFNAQPKYNYGGEVGIVFVGKDAGGNLGVEFFSAQKQSAISGTNSGGTELMTVDSNITAMIAKGGLIYNYKTIGNFRLYSGIGKNTHRTYRNNEKKPLKRYYVRRKCSQAQRYRHPQRH